ncbi:late embryogenis abundant protein 41 isoform X2 [Brassica rapa]|uniref:late embryogenis abundant protein 41 isoform X2 n=1 Tax=Brassica campestris TaxID=3711 RepID=UPI0004F16A07|nr:late embryogenis abundant protein 41 isoform X2 [Brassica rapa]
MAAARSLSGAVKSLCSAASHNISGSIVLRSYVATVPGFGKGGSTRVTVGKMEQRANQEAESAWAPDPVTGYYRPSNRADEIDPAELREMLLKNKAKPF